MGPVLSSALGSERPVTLKATPVGPVKAGYSNPSVGVEQLGTVRAAYGGGRSADRGRQRRYGDGHGQARRHNQQKGESALGKESHGRQRVKKYTEQEGQNLSGLLDIPLHHLIPGEVIRILLRCRVADSHLSIG
jgi:hypothetical protein